MVARALYVIVPAQRISSRTRPHVIARHQQQVRDGRRRIGAVAMLGDAHRPEDTHVLRLSDHMRGALQGLHGNAARFRGELHRERLQALAILLDPRGPFGQELRIRETLIEKIAADGAEPCQVRPGTGVQMQIGAPRHLVLAEIRHDQLLPAQFVRPLHARGEHRMALGSIAAYNQHQVGLLDIGNRSGIAAIAHSAPQTRRGGRLAIARAVIDVVSADNRARQFLHEERLFVGALGRGDERERVRPVRRLDFAEAPRHQVERFVPTRLAEAVAFADQRSGQPIGTIDEIPREFSLHASGNAVGGSVGRLDFQDVAIFRPNIKGASHAAVRADGLGAANARGAHRRLSLGNLQDGGHPRLAFHALDHVDHAVERVLVEAGKEARVSHHGFLHQRVARADRHAVAARHATRFADGRPTIPEHARMRIAPADGQSFVHLQILASLHAAAAQDALAGIVAVERIAFVHLVRLWLEGVTLVVQREQLSGVMNRTVSVVVVADRAVEFVIPQNAVERLGTGRVRASRSRGNSHPAGHHRRAGALQFAIDLHDAGVARLNGPELRMIADLRQCEARAVDRVNKPLSG